MKRFKLLAIIVLAIGVVAFNSCKKDELTNNNETKALTSTFNPNEIENMDEYLLGFMKEMKTATRDSEPMLLEDAQWHLSACLNFQFCNANVEKTQVVYDTIYTTINVNDGYVSLNDINASLQEISTEVLAVYNSSDLENKNVLFIKPEIQNDNTRNGNTVRTVVATSGRDGVFGYYYFDNDSIPLSMFAEDYYNWRDAAYILDSCMDLFQHEKPTDPTGRIYYTTIITVIKDYNDDDLQLPYFPYNRLYYCGSCTMNATISRELMAFYLDSYLGIVIETNDLIGENNSPINLPAGRELEYISSVVLPEVGYYNDEDKTESDLTAIPPLHHMMYIDYGIPYVTINPPIVD